MIENNIYNNGKIYKIISPNSSKVYVGSTCNDLHKRLKAHIYSFKCWLKDNSKQTYLKSYELIKLGSVDIILLESVNCSSKEELLNKEKEWIEQLKEDLINNNNPIRTDDDKKKYARKYMKGYYELHNDKFKQYYQLNRDKRLEYQNNYYKKSLCQSVLKTEQVST